MCSKNNLLCLQNGRTTTTCNTKNTFISQKLNPVSKIKISGGINMKTTHSRLWLAITSLFVLSLACSTFAPEPTATPLATITNTALPTQTSTPRPTKIPKTPTVTAVPFGTAVLNDEYEVDIVKVRKLGSVYADNSHQWFANDGYLFLELGVKVTNKRGTPVSITWSDIYTFQGRGTKYYPNWGGYKEAEMGANLNPADISFKEITDGDEKIKYSEVLFLRVIWTVKDSNPSKVFFGFGTSPLIQVIVD
jgi:hypothetical protein